MAATIDKVNTYNSESHKTKEDFEFFAKYVPTVSVAQTSTGIDGAVITTDKNSDNTYKSSYIVNNVWVGANSLDTSTNSVKLTPALTYKAVNLTKYIPDTFLSIYQFKDGTVYNLNNYFDESVFPNLGTSTAGIYGCFLIKYGHICYITANIPIVWTSTFNQEFKTLTLFDKLPLVSNDSSSEKINIPAYITKPSYSHPVIFKEIIDNPGYLDGIEEISLTLDVNKGAITLDTSVFTEKWYQPARIIINHTWLGGTSAN